MKYIESFETEYLDSLLDEKVHKKTDYLTDKMSNISKEDPEFNKILKDFSHIYDSFSKKERNTLQKFADKSKKYYMYRDSTEVSYLEKKFFLSDALAYASALELWNYYLELLSDDEFLEDDIYQFVRRDSKKIKKEYLIPFLLMVCKLFHWKNKKLNDFLFEKVNEKKEAFKVNYDEIENLFADHQEINVYMPIRKKEETEIALSFPMWLLKFSDALNALKELDSEQGKIITGKISRDQVVLCEDNKYQTVLLNSKVKKYCILNKDEEIEKEETKSELDTDTESVQCKNICEQVNEENVTNDTIKTEPIEKVKKNDLSADENNQNEVHQAATAENYTDCFASEEYQFSKEYYENLKKADFVDLFEDGDEEVFSNFYKDVIHRLLPKISFNEVNELLENKNNIKRGSLQEKELNTYNHILNCNILGGSVDDVLKEINNLKKNSSNLIIPFLVMLHAVYEDNNRINNLLSEELKNNEYYKKNRDEVKELLSFYSNFEVANTALVNLFDEEAIDVKSKQFWYINENIIEYKKKCNAQLKLKNYCTEHTPVWHLINLDYFNVLATVKYKDFPAGFVEKNKMLLNYDVEEVILDDPSIKSYINDEENGTFYATTVVFPSLMKIISKKDKACLLKAVKLKNSEYSYKNRILSEEDIFEMISTSYLVPEEKVKQAWEKNLKEIKKGKWLEIQQEDVITENKFCSIYEPKPLKYYKVLSYDILTNAIFIGMTMYRPDGIIYELGNEENSLNDFKSCPFIDEKTAKEEGFSKEELSNLHSISTEEGFGNIFSKNDFKSYLSEHGRYPLLKNICFDICSEADSLFDCYLKDQNITDSAYSEALLEMLVEKETEEKNEIANSTAKGFEEKLQELKLSNQSLITDLDCANDTIAYLNKKVRSKNETVSGSKDEIVLSISNKGGISSDLAKYMLVTEIEKCLKAYPDNDNAYTTRRKDFLEDFVKQNNDKDVIEYKKNISEMYDKLKQGYRNNPEKVVPRALKPLGIRMTYDGGKHDHVLKPVGLEGTDKYAMGIAGTSSVSNVGKALAESVEKKYF